MAFSVHYDQERGWVVGKFTGNLDPRALKAYAQEAVRIAAQYNCKHFLNDLREAEINFSTLELYNTPGLLSDIGIGPSWRIAVVVSHGLQDYAFFESVAVNRGFAVKVFFNSKEAMSWLESAPVRIDPSVWVDFTQWWLKQFQSNLSQLERPASETSDDRIAHRSAGAFPHRRSGTATFR
jgi:hypothetical protein